MTDQYFAYDQDTGFETFPSAELAKAAADEMISQWREVAGDGWGEEVEAVCWGEIKQIAQPKVTGEKIMFDGELVDPVDYSLADIAIESEVLATPSASIAEQITKNMQEIPIAVKEDLRQQAEAVSRLGGVVYNKDVPALAATPSAGAVPCGASDAVRNKIIEVWEGIESGVIGDASGGEYIQARYFHELYNLATSPIDGRGKGEWQPIETAPKNIPVWGFIADDYPQQAQFEYFTCDEDPEGGWLYSDKTVQSVVDGYAKPTHWRPIATPPNQAQEG